ncbi:MAG: HAD-IA family hydrolase [Caldilineaceae bacterium]|nr:HAD-IA family hydrolase [Caldilineaceae bacterium]
MRQKNCWSQIARSIDVKSEIIDELFYQIKDTQKPVEGTVDLLHRLSSSGYMLYALTDNVIEIVQYLKERYTFWEYFVGTVVSAEVNCMKPNPEIFLHLLDEYNILPDETVFIDDHMPNVESANNLGIHVVHFKDANECEQELKELGLVF